MTNNSSSAPRTGIFSWLHTDDGEYVRSFLAEFVGTALLVIFTCGACVVEGNRVGTALSFGLTVTCLVACFGHVSGCHINPSVTIGMLVNGQCNAVRAVIYIIGQLLGGIAGAAILYSVLENPGSLCSTTLSVNKMQGIAIEMFICTLLVFVICNVCESNPNMAPLLIGLAVTAGHLFAIPLTGSSMNTARSFGPAVVMNNNWENHEVYWIGPLLGGALGGFLHRFIFCNKNLYEKCNSNQNNSPSDVTTAI